jgi:beta-glucosidase
VLVAIVMILGVCRGAIAQPATIDFTAFDEQAEAVLAQMTLAEKIGQMTQAELGALKGFEEIKELALGSVLSGGGSDPKEGNELVPWTDVYDDCQRQALETRLGIPILYGVDAVHGHSNVMGAVIFPHNFALGCTGDADLVEQINRITALEVRATGINWNFAPCVTIPRDIRWGRTFEGFSEDPELVTLLGAAAVRGLQGSDLSDPTRIVACAKHFLGDGGTTGVMRKPDWPGFGDDLRLRLDQGDTQVDLETLRRIHLAPYPAAIAAGVGTIMPSYNSWNGVKCSGNKLLLTDILKDELGFEGFLISDYNAIDQITEDYKEAIRISTLAGMDMFMVPTKYREFIGLLTELVEDGAVPRERIDDAVRRILRVKAAAGLLDSSRSHLADRGLHEQFGSPQHRAVAREAVRKSLVLLKNEKSSRRERDESESDEQKVLPLAKNSGRIHVTGRAADDVGIQCGGWTVEWQGQPGDVTTGGTTILAGLREAVGDGAKVTYTVTGAGAAGADVAVVVVGELPYAEGMGDDGLLTLSEEDKATIAAVRRTRVPMVLVVISGRPLDLGEAFEEADAVVAVWHPGTEGGGVADVLLGDYAPTGKLSMTWPKSADQEPINVGDDDYEPAFPFGFGLGY